MISLFSIFQNSFAFATLNNFFLFWKNVSWNYVSVPSHNKTNIAHSNKWLTISGFQGMGKKSNNMLIFQEIYNITGFGTVKTNLTLGFQKVGCFFVHTLLGEITIALENLTSYDTTSNTTVIANQIRPYGIFHVCSSGTYGYFCDKECACSINACNGDGSCPIFYKIGMNKNLLYNTVNQKLELKLF